MSIETNTVNEKFLDNLRDYCHFAKGADFMSVTEWSNGDGFTVTISSKNMGDRLFQLTHGEWDALVALVSYKS